MQTFKPTDMNIDRDRPILVGRVRDRQRYADNYRGGHARKRKEKKDGDTEKDK